VGRKDHVYTWGLFSLVSSDWTKRKAEQPEPIRVFLWDVEMEQCLKRRWKPVVGYDSNDCFLRSEKS
jgi:hypothetical protein